MHNAPLTHFDRQTNHPLSSTLVNNNECYTFWYLAQRILSTLERNNRRYPSMSNRDVSGQAPMTGHALKNRSMWEAQSDEYESRHADVLSGDLAMSWGLWRIPESELQVLGDVAGRDILELGCGAARWSIALAQEGARPVGLDFSSRQLAHARR